MGLIREGFEARARRVTGSGDAGGRQRVVARLSLLLRMNRRIRDPEIEPRNELKALQPLQRWQSQRLRRTYSALLEVADSRAAAEFFLSDLYGDHDVSGRDREVERVMPMMQRLLPPPMLAIAADAIELAVLSHALDLRVAAALPESVARISDTQYAAAYQIAGRARLRRRQIDLVESVGLALGDAVTQPWIARLLRLARGPARLAGLRELQSFLERGFGAFGQLHDVEAFVGTLCHGERTVMRRLFEGHPRPFEA